MSVAVDTNVLFRALVDDPGAPEQSAAARARLHQAGAAWVPLVVTVELVWVLARAARLSRAAISDLLQHLLDNHAWTLQGADKVSAALALWREGPADFADYLIWVEAQTEGHVLLSFDRQLAATPGVEVPAHVKKR